MSARLDVLLIFKWKQARASPQNERLSMRERNILTHLPAPYCMPLYIHPTMSYTHNGCSSYNIGLHFITSFAITIVNYEGHYHYHQLDTNCRWTITLTNFVPLLDDDITFFSLFLEKAKNFKDFLNIHPQTCKNIVENVNTLAFVRNRKLLTIHSVKDSLPSMKGDPSMDLWAWNS